MAGLPGVIAAAIESVRPAAEARKIEVVPVVEGPATIMGDGERLQQVVWNLLSNAIKFAPNGGRIEVRLRTRGETVRARDPGALEEPRLPERDRRRDGAPAVGRLAPGLTGHPTVRTCR